MGLTWVEKPRCQARHTFLTLRSRTDMVNIYDADVVQCILDEDHGGDHYDGKKQWSR